jgi:hypothetical protein
VVFLCIVHPVKLVIMGNMLSNPSYMQLLQHLADVEEADERARLDEERLIRESHEKFRARNRHRNRGFALEEVNFLSDKDFRKMFRMDRASFEALLGMVSNFLPDVNQEMAKRSSGGAVSKRTKLYVTLRWLAGGIYLDLCFAWGISEGEFYDYNFGIVWPTIRAIDDCFDIGLPLNDHAALRRMAEEFSSFSHGQMTGCVTAIDGWVARTRKPFNNEVKDVMAYRNRHDCWGLVVLAGCDAKCRFTMFSCKNSGSTNDCIAWEMSMVKTLIDEGLLPANFYLIGDEAFPCTDQLLVPYSGRGLGVWKDSFNYHLSCMRQCIERAFALLTNRWGILWRRLNCAFDKWPLLLTVLAKLHNYCIDRDEPELRGRHHDDHMDGDNDEVLLNTEHVDHCACYIHNRRTDISNDLRLQGRRRPNHAAFNSRA